jgi:hypothetical protein
MRETIISLSNDIRKRFPESNTDNKYKQDIKGKDIPISWEGPSKAGMCTAIDQKTILIDSKGCYSHFLTNRTFTTEDFQITFNSSVTQSDYYYYFGLVNEHYSVTKNCMCCNPANAFYIQCDGSVHIDRNKSDFTQLKWGSASVLVTLKVWLSRRQIVFIVHGKGEAGLFTISGSTFKVISAHCNPGNGQLVITECFSL